MTTVGHPPRLLHGHAATHEVRLLHSGCMSTLDLFIRRFAVETFDPSGGKGSDLGAVSR
jgi:hypothetical protein